MLAGSCLRGVAFLEGTYSVLERCLQRLEGRGILEEALAVVLEGCGIFGGRCLERRGILEEQCFGGAWHFGWALVVFWSGMAFWRRRLQCFGGAWHFRGCCSVLEGCGILQKPLASAVFWRGVAFWRRCLQLFFSYF